MVWLTVRRMTIFFDLGVKELIAWSMKHLLKNLFPSNTVLVHVSNKQKGNFSVTFWDMMGIHMGYTIVPWSVFLFIDKKKKSIVTRPGQFIIWLQHHSWIKTQNIRIILTEKEAIFAPSDSMSIISLSELYSEESTEDAAEVDSLYQQFINSSSLSNPWPLKKKNCALITLS